VSLCPYTLEPVVPLLFPFLLSIRQPPTPPLFPYTTLFRSATITLPLPDRATWVSRMPPLPSPAIPTSPTSACQTLGWRTPAVQRSEEHTSELQSPCNLVCRLLLEKKKKRQSLRRIRSPQRR